ncbi:hypothetical protein BGZ61DRAFT_449890 [Ilyonectria robusta]|uniref:uncharacterized protein n=1 Tax=Ilyonectria robusta TaxID=1079257 RepID=UPI001E8DAD5C|nr:uncharacterized protein BGZ61DRAFT_449890 [Ilyonectria robusta]KAH8706421.1 hypothetical protein BGZ61DRAFT_449890 [Ilyonectria robusta]
MEFNGGNNRDELLKPRNLPLQAISQYESASDSTGYGDFFSGEPSTRSQSPSEAQPNASNAAITPRGPRIAVMLSASPSHHGSYRIGTADGISTEPVISDLTPKGQMRMLAATTSVIPQLGHSPTSHASATLGISSAGPSRSRGRPKGWKPGMPYSGHATKQQLATAAGSREARLVKQRPSLNGFPKRRGRPPKSPAPQPRDIYCKVNAPFVAFLCEWKGCKAELHNLDTLRRHVYVVHGGNSKRVCSWGKCGRNETPHSFDHHEGFKTHMEEEHLVPFAWHVGDGPNNSSGLEATEKMSVEDDIPDYLKDEDGNQVTPSVKDQQLEDVVTWKNNRRRLRELLIKRDENLPDETSENSTVEEGIAL